MRVHIYGQTYWMVVFPLSADAAAIDGAPLLALVRRRARSRLLDDIANAMDQSPAN